MINVYNDYNAVINQKYVEGNTGLALDYKVNVRSGRPIYRKGLMSNSTTVVPINLGLYYNPSKSEERELSMPNGWNFNYNQKVYVDGADYKYVDGKGLIHLFKKAQNSNDVYYDSAGTGLILKVEGVNYIIEDGLNNYLYFSNQGGYLYKITKVLGENIFNLMLFRNFLTYELLFIYEDNIINGQYQTSDHLVDISYNPNNTITIEGVGYSTITLTKDSNGNLVSITEEDSRLSEYTYENDVLSKAKTDNGEVSSFTYDENKRVSQVIDYVNNESNVTNQLTFNYLDSKTSITNFFGIKMTYEFDDEGTLISVYEGNNAEKQINHIEKKDESIRVIDDTVDEIIKVDEAQENEYLKLSTKKYQKPIVLTEKGNKVGEYLNGRVNEILDYVSEGLTEENRTIMYQSLNLINKRLNKLCEEYDS